MFSLAMIAIRPPDGATHRARRSACQTGTVLQRSAVAVLAPVQRRAEERADQVVVPHVNLDRVEADLGRHHRSLGMCCWVIQGPIVDSVRDLTELHAQRLKHPAGRQGAGTGAARVGDRASVADLCRDRGALAMHRIGQAPQSPGPGASGRQ